MKRAYSILEIKSVDEDSRVITGMATTPSPDRYGDVVEPKGAKFKNPMPLLWMHNSDKPVGSAKFGKATPEGIPFEARIEKIDEPGTLKDRLDEAWQSVKLKLVRAVSIGFRALEYSFIEGGGIRFTETEILELSLVTIPANADATIQTIKSIDTAQRAASGLTRRGVVRLDSSTSPGASGTSSKSPKRKETHVKKTVPEQIAEFEAKRAANLAQMNVLTSKAAEEGRTLNEEESEEFDGLQTENDSIDKHLPRLKSLEKENVATATPADGTTQKGAAQSRAGVHVLQLKEKLPPGIGFARYAKCLGLSAKMNRDPVQIAKSMYPNWPILASIIEKAAVAAGSTATGNWATNLVGDESAVFADFVEFLRPQTILGRFGADGVPALRRVPFRVPLITQTGGGSASWVGEGKAKPLTNFDFSRRTMEPTKVAAITVVTEEVLRDSSPSAETILRDALADAIRARLDLDFINPDKNAVAGVSPASITNGITAIASNGTDANAVREDLAALWGVFIAANLSPTNAVFIMSSTTALALSLMTNALGQAEFPGVTMKGGTLLGVPVITSEYVPSDSHGPLVILANASDIYLADEGGIEIALSREASLEMSDAPSHNSTTPTAAQLVSMFQTNSVAFRAERTVNWLRRREQAVAVLQGVLWGQGS